MREEEDEQRLPGMQGLPLQDLLPRLLVVAVVDLNDVCHIWSLEVVVTPAPPAAWRCDQGGAARFVACASCQVMSESKEAAAVWTDPFRSMAFQNICSEG